VTGAEPGTGAEWELTEDGTLRIRGEGESRTSILQTEESYWEFSRDSVYRLEIQDGIVEIDSSFGEFYNLEEVVLADSVKIIGPDAFGGCSSLRNLALPRSLEGVGRNAFSECNALLNVWFYGPDTGVQTVIGEGNDIPWQSQTPMRYELPWDGHIFTKVTAAGFAGVDIFWYLDEYGRLYFSGTGVIEDFTGSLKGDGEYCTATYIDRIIVGDGITGIGENAFAGLPWGFSILLPESFESIGAGAFQDTVINGVCLTKAEPEDSDPGIAVAGDNDIFEEAEIKFSVARADFVSPEEDIRREERENLVITYNSAERVLTVETAELRLLDSGAWNLLVTDYYVSAVVLKGANGIPADLFDRLPGTPVLVLDPVSAIEPYTFENNESLRDIYISGDASVWRNVGITPGNGGLAEAEIHYFSNETSPAVAGSGTYDDIFWSLNSEGVLRLFGSGCVNALPEETEESYPWLSSEELPAVSTVIAGSGITDFDIRLLQDLSDLQCLILPGDIKHIVNSDLFTERTDRVVEVRFLGSDGQWDLVEFESENWLTRQDFFVVFSDEEKYYVLREETADPVWWSLDSYGTLTVRCDGVMPDYDDMYSVPWNDFRNMITSVVIRDGVTSVGRCAFEGLTGLTTVLIPESVKFIGDNAFNGCTELKYVSLSFDLEEIGDHAFDQCPITNACWIGYPADDRIIYGEGNDALTNCSSTSKVNFSTYYAEVYAEGIYDTGFFWKLSNQGELLVYGAGTVGDRIRDGRAWGGNAAKVKYINIGNRITGIGRNVFSGLGTVGWVYVGADTFSSEEGAFRDTGAENLYCCGSEENVSPIYISGIPNFNCFPVPAVYEKAYISGENNGSYYELAESGIMTVTCCGSALFTDYELSLEDKEKVTTLVIDSKEADFISIGEDAFSGFPWLKTLVINTGLCTVRTGAFADCCLLERIYYKGTRSQWQTVYMNSGNEALKQAEIVCLGVTEHAELLWGDQLGKIYWTLDSEGTLELSGRGTVSAEQYPWKEPVSEPGFEEQVTVRKVVIGSGITGIAGGAFSELSDLETVMIPESIESIDRDAFTVSGIIRLVLCYGSGEQEESPTVMSEDLTAFIESTEAFFLQEECLSDALGVVDAGLCGEGLSWVLDKTGMLRISGSGAMRDYAPMEAPWYEYREMITDAVIDDGITSIGRSAFFGCCYLQRILFDMDLSAGPEEVSVIVPDNAFENCFALNRFCYSGMGSETDNGISRVYEAVCSGSGEAKFIAETPEIIRPMAAAGQVTDPVPEDDVNPTCFWILTDEGTLTISGRGEVQTYLSNQPEIKVASWKDYSSSVERVIIMPGFTSIGKDAFSGMTSMKEIIMPEEIGYIGENAFNDCSNLISVYHTAFSYSYDDGIAPGNDALLNAKQICFTYYGESVLAYGDCGPESGVKWLIDSGGHFDIYGEGDIPDYSETVPAPWAEYSENAGKLAIGKGIRAIGSNAFAGFTKLETVIFYPSYISRIGASAFGTCSSLENIYIYGGYAFLDNTDIEADNEPLLKAYRYYAYTDLYGNEIQWDIDEEGTLTINGGLEQKMPGFEQGCAPWSMVNYLTNRIIIYDFSSIGSYAFADFGNVKDVDISETVTFIDENAFSGCSSLSDVLYWDNQNKWASINFCTGNENLTGAVIHYAVKTEDILMRRDLRSIGRVTYTSDCWNRIKSARTYFDANTSSWDTEDIRYFGARLTAAEERFALLEKGQPQYTVVLYSRIEGTDQSAAPICGGGVYYTARGGDIIANDTETLQFAGWYEYYGTEQQTTAFTAGTEHINPDRDMVLTAVYVPKTQKVTVTVAADQYLICCNEMDQTETQSFDFTAGEEIWVRYTDTSREFLYWQDEAGNILGKDEELVFRAVRDITVRAVSVPKGTSGVYAYVTFVDEKGAMLSEKLCFVTDTITFPKAPEVEGKTFVGWSLTQIGIRKAMEKGNRVVVSPVYE